MLWSSECNLACFLGLKKLTSNFLDRLKTLDWFMRRLRIIRKKLPMGGATIERAGVVALDVKLRRPIDGATACPCLERAKQ